MGSLEIQDALRRELTQFTGTEVWFKHWSGMLYTEGVKFLAERARVWWFIDLIAIYQPRALKDPWLMEFQLWELRITDQERVAVCLRDTDDEAFRYRLPIADSALDYVRVYVEEHVILLPSEH